MEFERVFTLPYRRRAGPLKSEYLARAEVHERIRLTNCQRLVQLAFHGMGIPLAREEVLSMEASEGLGQAVISDWENGGLSLGDIRMHANNLDVVFAELLYNKDGAPIVRGEDWDARRKKSLHMGIHVYDHIFHAHLQGGGASFDPLPGFLERYSIRGLRRVDTSTAENVGAFINFCKSRISEQYPNGYWPH